MVPEAGAVVDGRFVIERLLDQGGMGSVWLARDSADGSPLAVKFLSFSLTNRTAQRRFRREGRALQQLDAPNIVKLIRHGLDERSPYIAMELLQGVSLRAHLRSHEVLAPRTTLDVLKQAATGLGAAHAVGIVHRDVKPSNLFLCRSAQSPLVKVIDFGIATGASLDGETQTSSTGIVGSPAYMSPEQARGEAVSQQADVWALAVVAFEMLTGREPFAGANVPDTFQRICSGTAPRASAMARNLPHALDAVFARAFARKLEDRFTDVFALAAAIEAAYLGAPNLPASPAAPQLLPTRTNTTASFGASIAAVSPKRPRPWTAPRSGLALALVLTGLALLAFARPRPPEAARTSAATPATVVAPSASLGKSSEPVAASSRSVPKVAAPAAVAKAATRLPKAHGLPRPVTAPVTSSTRLGAPTTPVDLDPTFGLPIGNLDESPGQEPSSSRASPDPQR